MADSRMRIAFMIRVGIGLILFLSLLWNEIGKTQNILPPTQNAKTIETRDESDRLTDTLQHSASTAATTEKSLNLVFCCREQNDLYQVLKASTATNWPRFDSPGQAIARATEGAGVLILANDYPEKTTSFDSSLYAQARAKRLRLYLEYPSSLPGVTVGQPRAVTWERAVIATDVFHPHLQPLSILAIHDCHFIPVTAKGAHIVLARVAGFDQAVYGLPKETFPILFEHEPGAMMIATTRLSQFVSGRYAPQAAWRAIWQMILAWLNPGADLPALDWTPTVRPSFTKEQNLPQQVEADALQRGANWFKQSRLLFDHAQESDVLPLVGRTFSLSRMGAITETIGAGKFGILEGYGAAIQWDGRQKRVINRRCDCIGESAMGLAIGAKTIPDTNNYRIAANLLDFLYFGCIAQQGVRADPQHPAFGLVVWGISNPQCEIATYGDDNARMLLGTMATAALTHSNRWDEAMLKCLLGNLRTTGQYGFRTDRIDMPDLTANGWQHYFQAAPINYAPHFEAYLWACYLWAYRHTGHALFLQRAKTAIEMTMKAYPQQWRWTNGIAQERARMLLPLAWLVRLEDTPEHRRWLRQVAEDLLSRQDQSGAIPEELGAPERGMYGPPRSNEDYGVTEATLIQANGDPACDLLYTTNFAFLGLHEAAQATQEELYIQAEEKLAKFLCRIQVRSEVFPELDGAWFRAFDFKKWEYWGSSADIGWGAWSIETGWTQGWIVAVFGLRQMETSLWELTSGSRIKEHFAKLYSLFFP